MKILFVEDDEKLAELILRECAARGYAVAHAARGEDALRALTQEDYDALVLDRMLPDIDGIALLQEIRARGCTTPVLFLSALGEVADKVEGLRAGGDDYLAKPFAFAELEARLLVLARRSDNGDNSDNAEQLAIADLTLDMINRRVTRAGTAIELSPREFSLLHYLLRHRGQTITRQILLEQVWQQNFHTQTNVVDMHISKLRAKIDKGHAAPLIHTIRGEGFMLDD